MQVVAGTVDLAVARCCARAKSGSGAAQVIAVKAPGFGERKTSYLEDIAILTGAQVVKDELGLSLDKVLASLRLHPCESWEPSH